MGLKALRGCLYGNKKITELSYPWGDEAMYFNAVATSVSAGFASAAAIKAKIKTAHKMNNQAAKTSHIQELVATKKLYQGLERTRISTVQLLHGIYASVQGNIALAEATLQNKVAAKRASPAEEARRRKFAAKQVVYLHKLATLLNKLARGRPTLIGAVTFSEIACERVWMELSTMVESAALLFVASTFARLVALVQEIGGGMNEKIAGLCQEISRFVSQLAAKAAQVDRTPQEFAFDLMNTAPDLYLPFKNFRFEFKTVTSVRSKRSVIKPTTNETSRRSEFSGVDAERRPSDWAGGGEDSVLFQPDLPDHHHHHPPAVDVDDNSTDFYQNDGDVRGEGGAAGHDESVNDAEDLHNEGGDDLGGYDSVDQALVEYAAAGAGPRDLPDGGANNSGQPGGAAVGSGSRTSAENSSYKCQSTAPLSSLPPVRTSHQSPADILQKINQQWQVSISSALDHNAGAFLCALEYETISPHLFCASRQFSAPALCCLVTQCSVDRLDRLERQALSWAAPLSVAVYVPTTTSEERSASLKAVRDLVARLGANHNYTGSLVVSVLFGHEDSPWEWDCGVPGDADGPLYPINALRNLAVVGADIAFRAPLLFLVDVDFIPSTGLSAWVQYNAKNLSTRCESGQLIVVPAFERHVPTAHAEPQCAVSVDEICGGLEANTVSAFHVRRFPAGHSPSNYTK